MTITNLIYPRLTWLILICAGANSWGNTAEHTADSPTYVGSDACQQCHQQQVQQWSQSDHAKAMQAPSADTVLGDFNQHRVHFNGHETTFYTQDEQFYIKTLNAEGTLESFAVMYTFGHYPLQQYLLDIGDGRLQAFDIAWDSRSKTEGGQRWYHLQPDEKIDPEHPFFWQGYFQNWNSRCADCHSTNLAKQYDPAADSYHTTWTDMNVACESCHGAGSKHVSQAKAGTLTAENTGFSRANIQRGQWQFTQDSPIAINLNPQAGNDADTCGMCHARRMRVNHNENSDNFFHNFQLQNLAQNLYHADGQIQDEVFVMGSFTQSKMYAAGVSCLDCHNPHTGKLIAEPNQVCAQCHKPRYFESPKHSLHAPGDAQCVDCHMPETTYMGVDPRRDHSFSIPRPKQAQQWGAPVACLNCHTDKDPAWAEQAIQQHYHRSEQQRSNAPAWMHLNHRARQMDNSLLRRLSRQLDQDSDNPIIQATLIEHLANFPSQEAYQTLSAKLSHTSPQIRSAAVASLGFLQADMRWQLLHNMINDPAQTVRFAVASQFAQLWPQLSPAQQQTAAALMREYDSMLAVNADSPTTQLAIAQWALAQGNTAAADAAYSHAITLAPHFSPALLNYAEFSRQQGATEREKTLLLRALKATPDSASVQHAVGLMYVRAKQYTQALVHLKAATGDLLDAAPRYAYVYAIALDNQGQTSAAITALEAANRRWPRHYDLLSTLVMYLDKTQDREGVLLFMPELIQLAPNAPLVQQLRYRYKI